MACRAVVVERLLRLDPFHPLEVRHFWEFSGGDKFQTILGCGEFSPLLHRRLWELLERHAGVDPISQARSRRTVQVAQHDHRLTRLREVLCRLLP
jgi:hypothetical protein